MQRVPLFPSSHINTANRLYILRNTIPSRQMGVQGTNHGFRCNRGLFQVVDLHSGLRFTGRMASRRVGVGFMGLFWTLREVYCAIARTFVCPLGVLARYDGRGDMDLCSVRVGFQVGSAS